LTFEGISAICTAMHPISPKPFGFTEDHVTKPSGFGEAPVAWIGYVREGLPLAVVDQALADGRISAAELDRIALSRKTLAHRRGLGLLTPDQSDRLSRLLRTIEEAEATFGDRAKAHAWLRRPSALLDGESPLDRLDTDLGTRQVEAILGRIAHGLGA
jgi:putative toxin-antitoxin system antitoxin component (TIGR02293 family)